ncbi:3-keto-5-aminohexanoate cleavage protein [Pararobbsia silviterrae]|uniref:3-keto-5-aminohexanoate cleavage protein n=1 Tax=Pararobbsia silviterrae TaxID=1792498 RepID=A0A494YCI1_9BURK|nr:3-keto-5-aminohexanoate cleavage protein [Pararobbsia silviterrae]RKP58418.1 3-keto-5-aminohexanoate cleavage protein [Pararobbsia silviterrae]
MAKQSNNVIITCAVTGAIHTPSMSPYLPLTPDEIADQALGAAHAGAAILHLHARDPHDGRPSADPDVFAQFLPRIKAGTDAVINITSGGSTKMTLEERLAPPLRFKPEMASLNMGSMNFSIHPVANKIKDWKYPWEQAYVEGTEDIIFRNTFRDIRHILRELGEGCGTRFEFECYDVGHLYNLAYFVDAGLVKPPFLIQTIFGILGGIGPDPQCVTFMRDTANRLFGDSYHWSVLAAGRHQMPLLTHAAVMGANMRVGLEDSLYLGRGQMAETNAAQVSKIRRILDELGIGVATPDEARAMLDLKGADRVAF